MTTATIQLPKRLYNKAARASKHFQQPVESILKQALKYYLSEFIADLKDERNAQKTLARVKAGKEPVYTMKEVKRMHGLED